MLLVDVLDDFRSSGKVAGMFSHLVGQKNTGTDILETFQIENKGLRPESTHEAFIEIDNASMGNWTCSPDVERLEIARCESKRPLRQNRAPMCFANVLY